MTESSMPDSPSLPLSPLYDYVLIRVEPQRLSSVLWTGRSERFDVRVGTVAAAGPGHRSKKGAFIPTSLRPGDRVLFPFARGAYLRIHGEDFAVLREDNVLGWLDGDFDSGVEVAFSP